MLEFPLEELLFDCDKAPNHANMMALSYLFDKLSELSEKLDELTDATRNNI